ncbi:MAG: ABC transporter permease [Rhodothermales bacterium]
MNENMPTPSRHHLPAWAIRFVGWLSTDRNRDTVVGDFAEAYHDVAEERGAGRAIMWYVGQVLKSVPAFLTERLRLSIPMLSAYGTSAFRNLSKRKFFSALNIAGLAIGMATCLMIFQYVAYESGYDTFHEHRDNLYRVVIDGARKGSGESRNGKTWRALEASMRERMPSVVQGARVHANGTAIIAYRPEVGEARVHKQPGGLFVDSTFFELFSYQMLRGNGGLALSSTDQMLISASMARKYFGATDPMGKRLQLQGWTRGTYTVAGVFADPPEQAHLSFDYLLPIQSLLELPQYHSSSGWKWQNFVTYVRLYPGTDAGALSPTLTSIIRGNTVEAFDATDAVRASMQPIAEIHLMPTGRPGFEYWRLYVFGGMGILVLAIAWVNFINLTTARAIERAKEVGVRKTIGATRGNVVAQFLVEATITNSIAFVLAALLAMSGMPYLQTVLDIHAGGAAWEDYTLWGGLAGVFVFGILLSCLYPVGVLSRFEPIAAITSKTRASASPGRLRRVLVTLQFSAATGLLIGTAAVFSQVHHMQSVDLGLELDQVLVVEAPSRADRHGTPDIFRQKLRSIPEVEAVSSGAIPGTGFFMDMPARKLGDHDAESRPFQAVFIDDTFLETYELALLAGRNFRDAQSDGLSTVLNHAGVRVFGFLSAEAAIGERIVFNEDESNYVTVIGVVEDFNWMSVKDKVGAIGFLINQSEGPFSIKVNSANLPATLAAVQSSFESVYPASPYEYYFANERFNAQYHAEQRSGALFGLFSFFALVVACLGLIGLVAHMVSQRIREIGIRKIMGASPGRIAILLVAGLAKSLGVALPLAVLGAYIGISQWLEAYAARIDLTWSLFLWPCFAVCVLALLTVSYHTLRAAYRNPVVALRSS